MYGYDNQTGLLNRVTRHANTITDVSSWVNGSNQLTVTGDSVLALVGSDGNDRSTRYFYDAAGRQTYVEDAAGYVTEYRYNTRSQLVMTLAYGTANIFNGADVAKSYEAQARVSRSFYADDGQVLGDGWRGLYHRIRIRCRRAQNRADGLWRENHRQ